MSNCASDEMRIDRASWNQASEGGSILLCDLATCILAQRSSHCKDYPECKASTWFRRPYCRGVEGRIPGGKKGSCQTLLVRS